MAPAASLARLRKQVLDLVTRGRLSVVEACRHLGISRSRYYELRHRYLAAVRGESPGHAGWLVPVY